MIKLVKVSDIKGLILELRGQKVMLDRDLAMIYGISTKRLKEQVKRNIDRFPNDFMFQLTREEVEIQRSQIATFDKLAKRFTYLPYAFTRNGANMLSAVLKTSTAVQRSIQIMRAFSALEEAVAKRKKVLAQSPEILKQLSIHSKAIMHLFQDSKLKGLKISKIQEIQGKMITLLQQIVLNSIEVEKDKL